MQNLLKKLQGDKADLPAKASKKAVLLAWLGGFLAISAAAMMSERIENILVLGSFGASCVILFALPDTPFAQPRNVILGHFFSSLVGLLVVSTLGVAWWTLGIAVGTAIAVMMLTRTLHPPAGSNPVIVWLMAASHGVLDWNFLWFPTLFGAIVITIVALVYNNLTREGNYPKYWF